MKSTSKQAKFPHSLPGAENWLGPVQPAWLNLDYAGFEALRAEPSHRLGVLRFRAELASAEVEESPVVRNAIILIDAASKGGGIKLTATGNLSRAVVDDMRDRFEWPGYDKATTLALCKVVNEPDFMPLHFIRLTAEHAGLLRRRKGMLKAAPSARELVSQRRFAAMQSILFYTAFWRFDLSYFGRGLLGSWPQRDIGIVLWSLGVSAWSWQSPERLVRLCAIPTAEVVEQGIWDRGSMAFEARILRPLFWFGLMERRAEKSPAHELAEHTFYRKSPLFDRFLEFDVRIAASAADGNA